MTPKKEQDSTSILKCKDEKISKIARNAVQQMIVMFSEHRKVIT